MKPEQFGPYHLIAPLGRGGMAEVFLAKTIGVSGFEKLLALKRLLPSCSEDEHVIDLLADEARITVQLDHPNIVQVFDFGCVDDSYYIAMEYVDGVNLQTLGESLRAKSLNFSADIALHIAIGILDGLAFAHGRTDKAGRPLGIIHRDVTPHNVLISRYGEVKLTDFGVARARISNHVSQVGDVRGKYSYMPPEQVCGGELDHRVDIFAAGAILYELLCGVQPFRSASFREQMRLLTRPVAPPSQIVQGLPEALDDMTLKALHVDPQKRFESTQGFADALRDELDRRFDVGRPAIARKLAEQVEQHRDSLKGDPSAHGDIMRRPDYDGTSGTSLLSRQQRTPAADRLIPLQETPTAAGLEALPMQSIASPTEVVRLEELSHNLPDDAQAPTPQISRVSRSRTTREAAVTRSISGEIRSIGSAEVNANALTGPHTAGARVTRALSDQAEQMTIQPSVTPTDATPIHLVSRMTPTAPTAVPPTTEHDRVGLGESPTLPAVMIRQSSDPRRWRRSSTSDSLEVTERYTIAGSSNSDTTPTAQDGSRLPVNDKTPAPAPSEQADANATRPQIVVRSASFALLGLIAAGLGAAIVWIVFQIGW
jgi:serine/threonine protein kinase